MSAHSMKVIPPADARHRTIQLFAAALSGVTAVLYLMIALRVVSVLEANADQTWALAASAAYAFGAVLLLTYQRRIVWVLGAVLQVFVIVTYFNLATQRIPAYEVWGILIRVVQFAILIALVYLASRRRQTTLSDH